MIVTRHTTRLEDALIHRLDCPEPHARAVALLQLVPDSREESLCAIYGLPDESDIAVVDVDDIDRLLDIVERLDDALTASQGSVTRLEIRLQGADHRLEEASK